MTKKGFSARDYDTWEEVLCAVVNLMSEEVEGLVLKTGEINSHLVDGDSALSVCLVRLKPGRDRFLAELYGSLDSMRSELVSLGRDIDRVHDKFFICGRKENKHEKC